jgi:hypothetical protein
MVYGMTIEQAKALRNWMAKMIRSGKIAHTAEYDALDSAIHAAEAPAPVVRTAWYHLDAAADAWAEAAKHVGG